MPELSWSWSATLSKDVGQGETVKIDVNDDEFNPEAADTSKSEAAVGNVVYGAGLAPVSFGGDPLTLTVKNASKVDWAAGQTLYAYLPRKGAAAVAGGVQAQLDDHEARLTALEGGGARHATAAAPSTPAPKPEPAKSAGHATKRK